MKSNVVIANLPDTKKAVYFKIEDCCLKNPESFGLYALLGPRRVGKSTVLKQLCESHNGYYFNVEELSCDYNSELDTDYINRLEFTFTKVIYSGVRLICIDEITKVPRRFYGKLTSLLKAVNDRVVIISGNSPYGVRDLAYIVGAKKIFTVHSLNYWEYCKWFNMRLDEQSYTSYLKYKQIREISDVEAYVGTVWRDAMTSYYSNLSQPLNELKCVNTLLERKQIENCTKLIGLMEQLQLVSKGKIVKTSLSKKDRDSVEKEYHRLTANECLTRDTLEEFKYFLKITGLGEYYYRYRWDFKKFENNTNFTQPIPVTLNQSNNGSTACLIREEYMNFEFIGFSSSITRELIVDSEFNYNSLCKMDIFNNACDYFSEVGKLVDKNGTEVDFISNEVLIYVGNSSKEIVQEYVRVAKESKINQLIIATNEVCNACYVVHDVEVLEINLPVLSIALGMFQTVANIRESLKLRPVAVIHKFIKDQYNF